MHFHCSLILIGTFGSENSHGKSGETWLQRSFFKRHQRVKPLQLLSVTVTAESLQSKYGNQLIILVGNSPKVLHISVEVWTMELLISGLMVVNVVMLSDTYCEVLPLSPSFSLFIASHDDGESRKSARLNPAPPATRCADRVIRSKASYCGFESGLTSHEVVTQDSSHKYFYKNNQNTYLVGSSHSLKLCLYVIYVSESGRIKVRIHFILRSRI